MVNLIRLSADHLNDQRGMRQSMPGTSGAAAPRVQRLQEAGRGRIVLAQVEGVPRMGGHTNHIVWSKPCLAQVSPVGS